ncbi:MAG: cyanoexosortase A, partial [Coleofasciculaceae cyanobacterium SM2_3_26]|nr:cyanoexosortase A [Coleofasciculaceae cyanobacterium SM2_3_26]
KKEAFDYWHEGDGSRFFGAIAVFMFGFFYMFLLRQEQESGESNGELEGL